MPYDDSRTPTLFTDNLTHIVCANCSLDRQTFFIVSADRVECTPERYFLHIGTKMTYARYLIEDIDRGKYGSFVIKPYGERYTRMELAANPAPRPWVQLYGGLDTDWLEWCDPACLYHKIGLGGWLNLREDAVEVSESALATVAHTASEVAQSCRRNGTVNAAIPDVVAASLESLAGPIRQLAGTAMPSDPANGDHADGPVVIGRHFVCNLAALSAMRLPRHMPGFNDGQPTQTMQLVRLLDTVRRLCDATGILG